MYGVTSLVMLGSAGVATMFFHSATHNRFEKFPRVDRFVPKPQRFPLQRLYKDVNFFIF
jgi:hypothetical protein